MKSLNLDDLISKALLDELVNHLLDLYELTEQATASEFNDNYTFKCLLYRLSFNAIQEQFKNNKFVEDLSKNNKLILKVINSPLYIRCLTTNPQDYRRKNNSDLFKIFNICNKPSSNLDLFKIDQYDDNKLFGFFFYDESPDALPIVRFQIFDENWNKKIDWSSDSIQKNISIYFDETPVELPLAKLLASGDDQITPVTPTDYDINKEA